MKTVLIIFNEQFSDGYVQREHAEVHSVETNQSGTILTILLMSGTIIQYPWNRIRFVRVS